MRLVTWKKINKIVLDRAYWWHLIFIHDIIHSPCPTLVFGCVHQKNPSSWEMHVWKTSVLAGVKMYGDFVCKTLSILSKNI